MRFAFLLLFLTTQLFAQPRPGDVYRDYLWLPTSISEDMPFLRVGGKLDYATSDDHFPNHLHDNGKIQLPFSVDLKYAIRAEMNFQRVQSHVDTRGLRLQVNDSDWIPILPPKNIPNPATNYMFHDYPTVKLPLKQLTANDQNTFRLEVDSTQKWGWPQNIFYAITLRIYYDTDEKAHTDGKLKGIKNKQAISGNPTLSTKPNSKIPIKRVDYMGYYKDFDWEGNGSYQDWHKSEDKGVWQNHIGSSSEGKYSVTWNTEWLPDQHESMRVSARLLGENGVYYILPAKYGLSLNRDYSVELNPSYHIPEDWATREDTFTTKLAVHGDLSQAERYQIAWRSWSPCYARGMFLNGHKIYDREDPCYDYAEHLIESKAVSHLQIGENEITTGMTPLINGKMVHGMEVQYPGMMLKVKYRKVLPQTVTIREGEYEGIPHFIITTPAATYYYDKAGGGLSRLLDPTGADWIDFRREPWNEYPASAASAFRGLPNFVFGGEMSGAGHPGHQKCRSEQVSNNQIRTTSIDNKWQWMWTFSEEQASIEVLKVDPEQPYWFLYEGTPAGRFEPGAHFFGSSQQGLTWTAWDYYKGEQQYDDYQWAYFGHRDHDYALLIAQAQTDELSDTFSYLGNTENGINSPTGMVVFGFGRAKGAKPLMTEPNLFYLSLERLRNRKMWHRQMSSRAKKMMKSKQ
ncbi:MAG: hypothetical protein AAGI23_00035 [Bacteroidota bacterium]